MKEMYFTHPLICLAYASPESLFVTIQKHVLFFGMNQRFSEFQARVQYKGRENVSWMAKTPCV